MASNYKVPIVNWSYGSLEAASASQFQCEMLSDIENPKNIIAVLASNAKGRPYLSKRDNPDYCNNFLLIRNKKTNTIRVFETDQFLMSPYCASEKSTTNSFVKGEDTKTDLSASLNLSKVMGSKRNKRKIMEIEKTNVSIDEKKLKKTIQDNITQDNAIQVVPSANMAILPPCNREASTIEEVYDINTLISTEVLNDLESVAQEVLHSPIKDLSDDSRFTKFFVEMYNEIYEKNVLNTKMLLYVDALLTFLSIPARTLNKKNVIICQFSLALNKKLLQEFCSVSIDGRYNRSASMRDKTLCYLLVVLLIVNDYSFNIGPLSSFMTSSDFGKLPRLIRAIGGRSVKKSGNIFVLQLPLAQLTLGNESRKK